MTTATLPAVDAIRVFDDVLGEPHGYRDLALRLAFGDVQAGDQVFHGIASARLFPAIDHVIADALPGARVTLSFFRKSPAGQEEPNFIHSDREMGDWTAILYLNPNPPAGDGTSFWRHRITGVVSGEFDVDEARDLTLWERWHHVDAKFGRLLVFQSDLFHSRAIEANYGQGDDARLIQVAFIKNAAPAGQTVIRSATATDVPAIVDMGLRFLRESEYHTRMPANPEAMARTANFLLDSPDRALFVAERGGHLIGMIGLALSMQPLSGEIVAGEWFWYVTPDARGRTGVRLLRQAETWARSAGAAVLVMVAPNADVERLYASSGYDRFEVTYQRRF